MKHSGGRGLQRAFSGPEKSIAPQVHEQDPAAPLHLPSIARVGPKITILKLFLSEGNYNVII